MGTELIVLGIAFLLAGLLARAGRRVGLPTIPFFMAAGILVGPYTPGPVLFDHPEDLELLAAFGLIFLLFYLGVEFSLDDLTGGGRKLLASAGLYLGLNLGGGLAFGFALGWGSKEALVIAGATGISSSAIVTKLLVELRRLGNPETRLILGIIVLEDLFLALYLAALGADPRRRPTAPPRPSLLFARALAFLIVLGLVARYGTRVVGALITSKRRRAAGRAVRRLRAAGRRASPTSSACRTRSARSWPGWCSPARRRPGASSGSSCRCGTRSRRCSSSPSASRSIPGTSARSWPRPSAAVVMSIVLAADRRRRRRPHQPPRPARPPPTSPSRSWPAASSR